MEVEQLKKALIAFSVLIVLASFISRANEDTLAVIAEVKSITGDIETDSLFAADSLYIEKDSSWTMVGHLFSKTKTHFVSDLATDERRYIVLAEISRDTIEILFIQEFGFIGTCEYMVQDVTGDGINDFMLQWYPLSGCCPRDIRNILMFDGEHFGKEIEIPNPKFDLDKKLVNNMSYGHIGEVTISVSRITMAGLVTLDEYMYLSDSPDSMVKISYRTEGADTTQINQLPENLAVFDWFYKE